MTTEYPILFTASMVQAVLAGRKTQTRRLVKPQPIGLWQPTDLHSHTFVGIATDPKGDKTHPTDHCWNCPYGQIEDRIWVKETWQHENFPLGPYQKGTTVFYRADYHDDPHGYDGEKSPEGKYRIWKPSIFMPRSACRLVLEITDVRVERLQDISEKDAIAEGIDIEQGNTVRWFRNYQDEGQSFRNWPEDVGSAAIQSYRTLWDSLNAKRAPWSSNPWVWVVEFKKYEPRS